MEGSAPQALTRSVVEDNASAVAESIAEVALDAALDTELLKEIPFVSLLIKTFALGRGIRDRIFLKKLMAFLAEASRVKPEERARFSERLAQEPDLAERCGESALLLLDKLSEVSKARLMGFAFRRFVQGAIDNVVLHRIYFALDSMPIWRLIDLSEKYFDEGLGMLDLGTATAYQQLNFLEIYYGDKDKRLHFDIRTGKSLYLEYHQPFFRKTDIGWSVAEVIRDYIAEPDGV